MNAQLTPQGEGPAVDDREKGDPGSGDSAPVRLPLPDAVLRVLSAAATVTAERSGQPVNVERAVSSREAVLHLLDLLGTIPPLRRLVAQRCGLPRDPRAGLTMAVLRDVDGAELAGCLLARDEVTAGSAVRAVRAALAQSRRQSRREQRTQKRVDPLDKKARRDQKRLDEARSARDQARAKADAAETTARLLRAQLDGVRDQTERLQSQLDAASERTRALDERWRDPASLASTLADVLRATGAASQDAPGSAGDDGRTRNGHGEHLGLLADPREVGPGEPDRVVPGRTRTRGHAHPPMPALMSREAVTAAASASGLPEPWAGSAHEWLPGLLAALAAPPRPALQVGDDRGLQVQVLGAADNIGGSCVLVTSGGTRLLVDAGMRPNGTDAHTQAPPGIGLALSAPLDALVVTHAHGDHAGWVPAVVAQQPNVPVLATEATAALLQVMWTDSVGVMSRRAREQTALLSEQGDLDATVLPAYTREDVQRALARLQIVDFHRPRTVGDLNVELFEAGHIVGAAGVVVGAGPRRVVISGDVSRPGQMTVGGIVVPDSARGAELLLLESTYADRDKLAPRARTVEEFIRDISRTLSAGGRVLVPAFALGRAQEIALLLREHLPEADVLVEGLAADVSRVYERYTRPDGAPLQVFGGKVRRVPRGMTNAEITKLQSGVIVATSGMMTGGPALEWARKVLPDERDAVMVVGYQDAQSPGGQLLRLAEAGGGIFELPSKDGSLEEVPVKARVGNYQLGAHASASELVTIAAEVRADEVMLVHGRASAQRKFETRLESRGQPTVRATERWAAPSLAGAR